MLPLLLLALLVVGVTVHILFIAFPNLVLWKFNATFYLKMIGVYVGVMILSMVVYLTLFDPNIQSLEIPKQQPKQLLDYDKNGELVLGELPSEFMKESWVIPVTNNTFSISLNGINRAMGTRLVLIERSDSEQVEAVLYEKAYRINLNGSVSFEIDYKLNTFKEATSGISLDVVQQPLQVNYTVLDNPFILKQMEREVEGKLQFNPHTGNDAEQVLLLSIPHDVDIDVDVDMEHMVIYK